MDIWRILYNYIFLPLGMVGFRLVALFNAKVADTLAGRATTFPKVEEYLASGGRTGGIWYHAASMGEFLQASTLIKAIKTSNPGKPVYLSFSSPSVEKTATRFKHADLAFYLPHDTRKNMQRLHDLLKPRLVIFSKFDIWPNMVNIAVQNGISAAVTAATLSPDSGRISWPASSFHRSFYTKLSLVCAISEEDRLSYIRLGVPDKRCMVTGDTRFDQTFTLANTVGDSSPILKPFDNWGNGFKMICGSTWPADEKHLLPAIARLAGLHPGLKFVIVPHEPTGEHLDPLARFCDYNELEYEMYSTLVGMKSGEKFSGTAGDTQINPDARVVIVDALGVLASIYRIGAIAYVGGSFSTGVHNVMEPACFSLPVLFGPHHLNSYEARLMIACRGAFPVSNEQDICQVVERLLHDPVNLEMSGREARKLIEENLGATARTMSALHGAYPNIVEYEGENGN